MTRWQARPEFREVDVPEPGPGQVLIKVAGAGACHSDLHLMEWPAGSLNFSPPFTLGHENAGWVEGLGPGVEGFEVGDAVAVYGPWGCGRCRACRLSQENLCENAANIGALGGGLGRDGGIAPYMLVPSARLLIPIGDLDPVEAAPLSDAGLAPYHAIKRNLHKLGPGSSVLVIGVGGLGHLAIQILRAISAAQVIAADIDEPKLALALEAGADHAVRSSGEAASQIRDLTHGLGVTVVLDFVGTDATMLLGASVARPDGELTVVGLAGGSFPFRFGALPFDCAITIPYWGSAVELMEVLELARRGKIRARVHRFPLGQAADVYAQLREGKIDGPAVITPQRA